MNRKVFIFIVVSLFLITSLSALAADNCAADPKAPKIEQGKDGTYTFGKWTYKFTITAKGSKSEGYHGELSVDGKPADLPKQPTEGVCTPWGTMYWVGDPVLLWGAHGWMPKPKPSGSGAFVSLPSDLTSKLVVTAMVLAEDRGKPIKEDWIKKELQKMGALGQVGVTEEWFSLVPGKVHVLHDSRHYGHAEMVLEDKGEDKPFTVNIEGTVVELPRKLGEHRLVKHTLSSSVASMDLYVALSVEEVAAVAAE